jgi:hypothetical protein
VQRPSSATSSPNTSPIFRERSHWLPSNRRLGGAHLHALRGHADFDRTKRVVRASKKFTEPVALLSTQPADLPLPRTALRRSFNLLALRARCEQELMHSRRDGQDTAERFRRTLRRLSNRVPAGPTGAYRSSIARSGAWSRAHASQPSVARGGLRDRHAASFARVSFVSDQADHRGCLATHPTAPSHVTASHRHTVATADYRWTEFASRRSPVRSRYAPPLFMWVCGFCRFPARAS